MKFIKTVLIVICLIVILAFLPIISFYQADTTEKIGDTPLFQRQTSDATGEQTEDNDVYYLGQNNMTINIPLPKGKPYAHRIKSVECYTMDC